MAVNLVLLLFCFCLIDSSGVKIQVPPCIVGSRANDVIKGQSIARLFLISTKTSLISTPAAIVQDEKVSSAVWT